MRFAGGYGILLAAILAGLLLFVAGLRYSPPEPLPETAPADVFSAGRARAALGRVLEGEKPHPVGSDADAEVRKRIAGELATLGIETKERPGFACRWGTCAFTTNLVATMKGASDEALLLSCHYDSVPAAPGAADDGTGIAVLIEVARALHQAPLPRTVILLFDEGEEEGLLGADAFANSPEFGSIFAAINVDARGSGGPGILFQTGTPNGATVRVIASKVPRPFTSSALAPAYSTMPNRTDFTVWEERNDKLQGASFALLGDIAAYHTPKDTLANVDAGSLQHLGDGVLAAARGLGDASSADTEPRVWFDLLGAKVVHYPRAWSSSIAGTALALMVLTIALRLVRRRVGVLELVRGFGALPLVMVLALATGVSSMSLLRGMVPVPWTANAPFVMAAMAVLGLALAAAVAAALARGLGEGIFCGYWLLMAILGMALARAQPEASYVVTLPAAMAGLLGVMTAWPKGDDVGDGALLLASLLPALALVTLSAEIVWLLYPALGLDAGENAAIGAAILALAFAPIFALAPIAARWITAAVGIIVVLGLVAFAGLGAAFTETHPQRANVVVVQDEKAARITVGTQWGAHAWGDVPLPMRTALGLGRNEKLVPWSSETVLAADTPRVDALGPEAVVEKTADDGADRRVTLRVKSRRGARALSVLLPPGAQARFARAEGVAMSATQDADRWRELRVAGVPDAGVLVEITAARTPVSVTLADETYDLPPAAAAVASARPKTAVPTQRGDRTVVSREFPL